MTLKIDGRYELPASRQTVWDTMLQADVLRDCSPGCSEFEALDDTHHRATIIKKFGPIKATFKGQVELAEMDEPRCVVITGAGEGGIAGFAKGGARITLSDRDALGTSILEYNGDVAIGGKIAQLGVRLIAGVTKKLSDQFFDNLARRFQPNTVEPAAN